MRREAFLPRPAAIPPILHGKEGVAGSSPAEGLAQVSRSCTTEAPIARASAYSSPGRCLDRASVFVRLALDGREVGGLAVPTHSDLAAAAWLPHCGWSAEPCNDVVGRDRGLRRGSGGDPTHGARGGRDSSPRICRGTTTGRSTAMRTGTTQRHASSSSTGRTKAPALFAGFVLITALLALLKRRGAPSWVLLFVAGAGFAAAVTFVVGSMRPSGAPVIGWSLLWSIPLAPLRALGSDVNRDVGVRGWSCGRL